MPAKKVGADDIYQVICRDEQPVWSIADLAEELDVSKQTIRNHIGDVEKRWEVESLPVGKTTVYYVPEEHRPNVTSNENSGRGLIDRLKDEIHDAISVDEFLELTDSKVLRFAIWLWVPASVSVFLITSIGLIGFGPALFFGPESYIEFIGIKTVFIMYLIMGFLGIANLFLLVPSIIAQLVVSRRNQKSEHGSVVVEP